MQLPPHLRPDPRGWKLKPSAGDQIHLAWVLIARDDETKKRCERLHCYRLHLAGVARSEADQAGRQYCCQAARSA